MSDKLSDFKENMNNLSNLMSGINAEIQKSMQSAAEMSATIRGPIRTQQDEDIHRLAETPDKVDAILKEISKEAEARKDADAKEEKANSRRWRIDATISILAFLVAVAALVVAIVK